MASKRSRPYDDPPSPDSSDEDEPKTPIESESSSDEEEDVPPSQQQQTPKESSDENEDEDPEEDEEDEDEEEEEEEEDKTPIEPNTQKTTGNVLKPEKAVVKPIQEQSPVVEEDGFEKKVNRVWSFNDEIVIFQGMIDFRKNFNKDPSCNNHDDFFNFIKPNLGNDKFTKNQLVDKVRRLKKKFKMNLAKSSGGNDPEFSSSHELRSFQLSKRIWGDIDAANGNVKVVNGDSAGRSAKKPKTVVKKVEKVVARVLEEVDEEDDDMMKVDEAKKVNVNLNVNEGETDFRRVYPHLMKAFEGESVARVPMLDDFKACLSNVDSSKLEEWDRKWKKVRVAEMEAYISRLALIQEHATWFANAMKSSMN